MVYLEKDIRKVGTIIGLIRALRIAANTARSAKAPWRAVCATGVAVLFEGRINDWCTWLICT